MNLTLNRILKGELENHILPFFWQHGEDEAVLRKYMGIIEGAGCRAVCVESRPHPDFCGPKWWKDMDVILDEAGKRGMKVWILDDSHFPTGYANGALSGKPDALCRQGIFFREKALDGQEIRLDLRAAGLLEQKKKQLSGMLAKFQQKPAREFHDDSILCAAAFSESGMAIDLTDRLEGEELICDLPEGNWILRVCTKSRNTGFHRNYINMTEEDSVRVLIDAVYEPHWQRYEKEFGKTIAGFFSDEPELGNGQLYDKENPLGSDQDLPWGASLEKEVEAALGQDWRVRLFGLWDHGHDAAWVKSVYMDLLTKRVRNVFSRQISDWCHSHHVQYIGHIIEDDGQHCRTGSSLGHYFRGLQWQDMAGIDDIGGQVLPQGEEEPHTGNMGLPRNGEFYHYALAALAESAAAIEPSKHGNSMCEIFGNYGWGEGTKLQKYLADHFLVRGINHFVPHAFSAAAFPDMDCPPHFYAHGHNPLYRHFGKLMEYMNRMAMLTSSGKHYFPVAVLYHGESEWAQGQAMPFETPLHVLYDSQIPCRVMPADVFGEPDLYHTCLDACFMVNEERYEALIVPACEYLPMAAVQGIRRLAELGIPVFFVDRKPRFVCETGEEAGFEDGVGETVALADLCGRVKALELPVPVLTPEDHRIRILQVKGGTPLYLVVNEGKDAWRGEIALAEDSGCCLYDAWHNCCRKADYARKGRGTVVSLQVEPLKSVVIVFDPGEVEYQEEIPMDGEAVEMKEWRRSICEAAEYPQFREGKQISLPDSLAREEPDFSGFVRYESTFMCKTGEAYSLSISDAEEAVEVFLNGESLGLEIAPPYLYLLDKGLTEGENHLAVQVATTLERECYPLLTGFRRMLAKPPQGDSGLTGRVTLHKWSV